MTGSVKKRCWEVIRLLSTPHIILSTIKVFRLSNIRNVKFRRRLISFKYIGNYLVRSLDTSARGKCLAHHYTFLNSKMSCDALNRIVKDGITLWDDQIGEDRLSIKIEFPYYDMEGDLCVIFNIGTIAVYCMAFTVIDGNLVGIPEDDIVLVSHVQGIQGRLDLIKKATKNLDDISPVALLFVSVQAVAAALKLGRIAGITAKEQIVVGNMQPISNFMNSYDNLWRKLGGQRVNDMVFEFGNTPEFKPLYMIKEGHRCRTKYKRNLKCLMYNHILNAFRQKCLELKTVQSATLPISASFED